ncbi:hypothetical protein JMUB7547_28630 [Staphylococcus aureus]
MSASLVGSEMCIRDSLTDSEEQIKGENLIISATTEVFKPCLLYTSPSPRD